MGNGINAVLMQLAEAATAHTEQEKRAFVPMPGGEAAPPPMDPAMMGGGGMPPMDPAMMGGGGMPPMDPMAMAAGGADPAAIMAAQGAPVDPMMAAAGGATGVPAPAPAAAPPAESAPSEGSGKGGGQKEKLDEIYNMLTKVMGVLVGKGLLAPQELGGMLGEEQPQQGGVPAEQKVAAHRDEPERMGSVVDTADIPEEKKAAVGNALADLIMSINKGR